jgi:hypothetical protein
MAGGVNPIPDDGRDYSRTGVEEASLAPASFRLDQNYPNPFKPGTRISFNIYMPGDARLAINDLLGRSVRKFSRMPCSPGNPEIVWDGLDGTSRAAGSGIYVYVLSEGSRSLSRKMIKLE